MKLRLTIMKLQYPQEDICLRAINTESAVPSPSTSISDQSSAPSTSTPHQPAKKRKINKGDEIDEAILRSLKDIKERYSEQQQEIETEEALFGRQVAAVLHRLAPRQKAVAKLRIQQILTDAEFPDKAAIAMPMNFSSFL